MVHKAFESGKYTRELYEDIITEARFVRRAPYVEYETSFKTLIGAPCAGDWHPSQRGWSEISQPRGLAQSSIKAIARPLPDGSVQQGAFTLITQRNYVHKL
jgi:hypothetical protein